MDIAQIYMMGSVTWLAVISPGADFAIISKNSSIHGRKAGLASSLGIAMGCWVHISYAILGVMLIGNVLPDIFNIIRIIGAVYLAYLGITICLSKPISQKTSQQEINRPTYKYFLNGFLTNSLNPKTSMFVISLFVQIIGKDTALFIQLGWGGFISISHFIWFACVAWFMSTQKIRQYILQKQYIFNYIIGSLLFMLSLMLLLN